MKKDMELATKVLVGCWREGHLCLEFTAARTASCLQKTKSQCKLTEGHVSRK